MTAPGSKPLNLILDGVPVGYLVGLHPEWGTLTAEILEEHRDVARRALRAGVQVTIKIPSTPSGSPDGEPWYELTTVDPKAAYKERRRAEKAQKKKSIAAAAAERLDRSTQRAFDILDLRAQGKDLKTIGAIIGRADGSGLPISRERVRQLESKAIRLKAWMTRRITIHEERVAKGDADAERSLMATARAALAAGNYTEARRVFRDLSRREIAPFRVEPNPDGGFYVVEHTADGYDIPRGWTFPDRAMAERALPLVQAGTRYPDQAALEG